MQTEHTSLLNPSVTFTVGTVNNDVACISFPIIDDVEFEVDQSFDVTIESTSSPYVLVGYDSSTTVSIVDDERKYDMESIAPTIMIICILLIIIINSIPLI